MSAAYTDRRATGTGADTGTSARSHPLLDDPNFDRSVVYMVEHHDEGALGLVLNRPSGEELVDPLEGWVTAQSEPSQVFSGWTGRTRCADRPRPHGASCDGWLHR